MGARLYNPTSGRFASTDPVVGSGCNAYDYVCGDPVDKDDISGQWGIGKRVWHWWGIEFRYSKHETKVIAFWFWDFPGTWGFLSFGGAYKWFQTLKKVGLAEALLGSGVWGVIAAVAIGILMWIGSTALWADANGRCLRLNESWILGAFWPSQYHC